MRWPLTEIHGCSQISDEVGPDRPAARVRGLQTKWLSGDQDVSFRILTLRANSQMCTQSGTL